MKVKNHHLFIPFLCAFLLIFSACEKDKSEVPRPLGPEPKPPLTENKTEKTAMKVETDVTAAQPEKAVAYLNPTEGNKTSGTVVLTAQNGSVMIMADFEGLPPGKHGFHIHEKGDCSAPDATSAGGHFNPDNSPHAGPDNPPGQRHVGDLGNIEADSNGKAHYEREDPIVSLKGPHSVIGKAVIIHADADDLESQPTGNAGSRLACGVIQVH